MKGYLTQLGDLRRQGKLNDKIQAEIKEECEKPKRVIHKRLNEQFPNRFVDEGKRQNHSQNRRILNPILIKYSITFSSYI